MNSNCVVGWALIKDMIIFIYILIKNGCFINILFFFYLNRLMTDGLAAQRNVIEISFYV